MLKSRAEIRAILKKHWGYDSFRELQEEIIMSVLEGRDTLGLMPTGGGKSITFQVPGLCYDDGLTIVVTPLISLMKDQIDNLKRQRIKAVALNSGMTTKENRIAWEHIINGKTRFLYVSPERLQNERFLLELKNLKVNLITVDEAHCISQWGYDFRPSYLNLRQLRKIKPDVPVLALTATATPEVVEDIMKQLDFHEKNVFKKSFTRDNINYIVRRADTKIYEVLNILSKTTGTAIVYVRNRKKTKLIADYLSMAGVSATYYHARLDPEIRAERQNDWKQGKVRAMVATNAFGMGIDKPDVRVVIHYDLPPTLEEYYQEAGRAGRDGKNSYAVLLTSRHDKAMLKKKITESFPPRHKIKQIYENICVNLHFSVGEGYEAVREFDIDQFCRNFEENEKLTMTSLRLLGQSGYMLYIENYDKRSRLKITCDREDLYDVHFTNSFTENVLKTVLRLYTGLFIDYVYIRESEIAYALKADNNRVYESLLELERMKVISYVPRSALPMIYLPTAREEITEVKIPLTVYEDRKRILENRANAVIDFAFSDVSCRVKRMLGYFGETDAKDCGRCDVCRQKKKEKNGKDNDGDTINLILSYLKEHPEGTRFITLENRCGPAENLNRSLAFLCNEGFIRCSDNLYFINS